MLPQKQLERYADILLWGLKTARKGGIKKNDCVLVRYDLPAVRLAELIYARLLEAGLHPIQRAGLSPAMESSFYDLSNRNQLRFQPPGEAELYRNLNGGIYINAPASLTHLAAVDARRISTAALARKPLRDILDEREAKGRFGWTLCLFPTDALADHAGLTMDAYSAQIAKACFLNRRNPVAHWRDIYKAASDIKKWLNRMDVDHYHIESDGVALEIYPGEKRKWVGVSGHNIPSFELFFSPDCRKTRGTYYADQPSYRSGNMVSGVRLEFKNGKVVESSADTGEGFLRQQLSTDRGAGRVGEFSLTDKRFSKIDTFMADTLFDENFGGKNGNCHIAVGAAYTDTYDGDPARLTRERKKALGFNDSAIHWDLVNTEKKRVTAHLKNRTRTTIYENGRFAY
jgi:aminopeptidase